MIDESIDLLTFHYFRQCTNLNDEVYNLDTLVKETSHKLQDAENGKETLTTEVR